MASETDAVLLTLLQALHRIADGDFNHAEHAKNIAKKALREMQEVVSNEDARLISVYDYDTNENEGTIT